SGGRAGAATCARAPRPLVSEAGGVAPRLGRASETPQGSTLLRRISSSRASGTWKKDRTTAGSKCAPAHRLISALATSKGLAFEYGRSKVIASKASTTMKILAAS